MTASDVLTSHPPHKQYEGGEPCSICGHRLAPVQGGHLPSVIPSEIIPSFLYVGSYDHASRPDLLNTLGIGNILNLVPPIPNLYKNSFTYHTVSTMPIEFEECYLFLENVRQSGGKVLIHCMSGNSKSPSVAAYYLMRSGRFSLQDALEHVTSIRKSTVIRQEDLVRLQEAEKELLKGLAAMPFGWPPHSPGETTTLPSKGDMPCKADLPNNFVFKT